MFCDMLAHVSLMRCIKSLVSRTCVLYDVHVFLHQLPNSVVDQVNRTVCRTRVSCWRSWTISQHHEHRVTARTRHFRRSFLKADKVSKNDETRKVEYAYQFQKCADKATFHYSSQLQTWLQTWFSVRFAARFSTSSCGFAICFRHAFDTLSTRFRLFYRKPGREPAASIRFAAGLLVRARVEKKPFRASQRTCWS